MKKIILTLVFALAFGNSNATEKEVIVEVVFENLTEKDLISGVFFITETNERIEIIDTKSFTVKLPSKGKYQFGFATDEFNAYTYYPARITSKKNTITIRLEEKKERISKTKYSHFPLNKRTKLTDEQIEFEISKGNLNIIIHGIDNTIPEGFTEFKGKYGIGVQKENCVVDPLSFKRATENNQMISDYLTRKYGEDWINELPTKPFGIK